MKSKGRFQKVFPTQKLYGDPVLLFWLRLLRKSRWPWKSASIEAITYFFSNQARFYGRYMSYLQAAKRNLKFQAILASQSWCKNYVQAAKMQDPVKNNNIVDAGNESSMLSFLASLLYCKLKNNNKAATIKRGWSFFYPIHFTLNRFFPISVKLP